MDKSSEYIRTLLSQHDPLTVISEVQSKHGLDLPNVGAVYPLLDFQGYTRHDVHRACLNAITNSVLAKIQDPEFTVEQYGLFHICLLLILYPYFAHSQQLAHAIDFTNS